MKKMTRCGQCERIKDHKDGTTILVCFVCEMFKRVQYYNYQNKTETIWEMCE